MVSKQSQFDALVRATSADLYRFAYWLCGNEALDHNLTQETYLRAWRSLDNLRETAVPYKQIIIAMGEGAKASLSAFDHLIRSSVSEPSQAKAA